jgi:hypothetical protein
MYSGECYSHAGGNPAKQNFRVADKTLLLFAARE